MTIKFYSVKRFYDHILMFFLYSVPNIILRTISLVLWPKGKPDSINNVCIYRVGNIGDLVCAIPALIAIKKKFPEAKISLLTSPGEKGNIGALETLRTAWFIDEIINYYTEEVSTMKGIYQLSKKLRKKNFDAWIYLPKELDTFLSLLKIMFFSKACKAKWSCGYFLTTNRRLNRYQFRGIFFLNEVERLKSILGKCIGINSLPYKYNFPTSIDDEVKAKEICSIAKTNNVCVGFVTTAKRPHNEWPIDRFEALGRLIKEKYPEAKIITVGGSDACQNTRYLKQQLGDDFVVDLSGRISLQVTSELLLFIDLLVTNNTGPMHMASMQNIPTIAIFSSAEFQGKWYPYGRETKVFINEAIPCAGCYYTKNCEYECIKSIKVEDVWDEVFRVLNNKGIPIN